MVRSGKMPWRFTAQRFEREGVVGANMAFLLDEEQLIISLIGRQEKRTHLRSNARSSRADSMPRME